MKKYIILLIIGLGFILTACGGGSNSNDTSAPTNMVIDKVYTIRKGQTITKISEPTIVKINTDTLSGTTTAVLKSGSAKIE